MGSQNISSPEVHSEQTGSSSLAVFNIPQFRWLFFGNLSFFLAMQGQMLTRSLLAWELTGEATALAYINLIIAIPMIFASLIGGAVTDRVERRKLLIFGQTLIIANELFILTLLLFNRLEFWHMLCTAFVAGCAFPFIMPARMAITVNVVGPQRIQSALAFQAGALNFTRVFGPAMMGIVIAQTSFVNAYYFSTVLYGFATLFMFGIKPNYSVESPSERKPLFADIGYGFKYIFENRSVLICLLFGLLPMFLAMPFQNILVVMADETWQAGESGVGILMAAGGIGGVIGALWVAKKGDSGGQLNIMLGSTFFFGVFLAAFTQTANFYFALIPLLIANVCASACQTVNNAAIQLLVDDSVRGRMSSFMLLSFGLTPIGVFPMAIAADSIGAGNAILGASVGLMIAVVLFYLTSTTLRNLDSVIDLKLNIAKS